MTGRGEGASMSEETRQDLVFLIDVDNTLIDDDAVGRDLRALLERALGPERNRRYWAVLEQLREETGHADHLAALQRYRAENPRDPDIAQAALALFDYPFSTRLYPGVPAMLASLRAHGLTVLLTDGDVAFQPRRISRAGLWEAVEGRVLIYAAREQMFDDVERRFPARRYIVVDDELRLLAAAKAAWQERATTAWPRQGRYALDRTAEQRHPAPDVTLARVTDLVDWLETSLWTGPIGK